MEDAVLRLLFGLRSDESVLRVVRLAEHGERRQPAIGGRVEASTIN
jgi:hypothetical protein